MKEFNLIREFVRTYFHLDWYLDDISYMAVWKGYLDELKDIKHALPLYQETKGFLKLSPKEMHEFLCQENFCLSSKEDVYNWIKSFNEYLAKRIEQS